MKSIKKLYTKPLYRYIIVGGFSYLVEVGLLFLLLRVLKLTPILSVAISFWVGFLVAFLLQKIVTFKDTSRDKKSVTRQTALYCILVAFNYLFTLAFVAILSRPLGTIAARTLTLIITTGWNYVVYSKLIFKEDNEKV